jgi:2-polyprenyl-3-methyl-5-hydroxy-6-metoxy-1,4-benzoquinol methylase
VKETDYALGHAEAELRRLTTQASLIDPITRRFVEAAGVGKGMRVLDIGSGAGDVALLCGEIVGPTGEVVGTDLALAAIDVAVRRATASGSGHISFRHGDPAELSFDQRFDAVVGRYVLQFMPDPALSLRRIARHLRPGGIMVFHELDWDGARSSPASPTYDQVCNWLSRTIAAAGAQVRLGARLGSLFEDAGLPPPTLRMEAIIGNGPRALKVVHLVTDLVETQLPAMERLAIASLSEVDFPTLADRILSEVGSGGTLMGRSEMGAWTTIPT